MEQIRNSVVSLPSEHTLNARESLHQIRRLSEDTYYDTRGIGSGHHWRLSFLKVTSTFKDDLYISIMSDIWKTTV